MTDKNLGSQQTQGQVWQKSAGGILIPVGTVREASNRMSTNFLAVKVRAEGIEQLYADAGVTLPRMSGLGRLIANAKRVSDHWLAAQNDKYKMPDVFAVMHMLRIAEAVLPLADHPRSVYYLERLLSGEIDFFKRVESEGKNALWELELWSLLRRNKAPVELLDPPDIVANVSSGVLGIACKKVYSEANFEKTLSQAAQQVKDHDIGIVAVNIDDVTPADTVLRVNHIQEANQLLITQCEQFLERHERHFRKYLSQERLVAALVSIHVLAEVKSWSVPFNNYWQALIWRLPDLSEKKAGPAEEFRDMITGARPTPRAHQRGAGA